jgi:hypothetical protein
MLVEVEKEAKLHYLHYQCEKCQAKDTYKVFREEYLNGHIPLEVNCWQCHGGFQGRPGGMTLKGQSN